MGKSQGNLHCAPPLMIPHCWEPCLPIMLDCLPVQSFHNSTMNFRVHASVTFLSTVTKGHFSWYAFLNVWKRLRFTGEGSAGVRSVDSALLCFIHEMFFFTNGCPNSEDLFGLQLSRCDVLFRTLQRNLFSFMSFMHVQSTSKSKSAYFCPSHTRNASKSGFGKFRQKKLRLLSGNGKAVFGVAVFVNDRIWNF